MAGKVLIIGSGGREHALGWNISQSKNVEKVFYAPGNAGTCEDKGINVDISPSKQNFHELLSLVKREGIDVVIVGPEAPLNDGIVDIFESKGYNRVFGPNGMASQLESDKFFSYDMMKELQIPQANSTKCHNLEEAIAAIEGRTTSNGVVIKARGLTGGKGVYVCDSKKQALDEIVKHMEKYGREVLIAERLFGEEFSVFGISDGDKVFPIYASFQDHKRRDDDDKGPNTGGMGAYGPVPAAGPCVISYVANGTMTPIIKRMKERGREYKGFLYAGMIMTKDGPKVLEFNVRFGDPECQPAMMLLKNSLYEPISSILDGNMPGEFEFNKGSSCCVVLASKGYPDDYRKGLEISGLKEVEKIEGVKVFHSGTKRDNENIITSGGRVLGVTAYSADGIIKARELAYGAAEKISIPNGFHYRRDIGARAIR